MNRTLHYYLLTAYVSAPLAAAARQSITSAKCKLSLAVPVYLAAPVSVISRSQQPAASGSSSNGTPPESYFRARGRIGRRRGGGGNKGATALTFAVSLS